MIIREPEYIQVTVGETAYFNCIYTGSSDYPVRYINHAFYYRTGYPPRHSYKSDDQVLELSNSQLSNNGSTYQCGFLGLFSRIATLTVLQQNYSSLSKISMKYII